MTGGDFWEQNDDGFWCPSCGFCCAGGRVDPETLPDECQQCGFPDIEQVAAYHLDDDDHDGPPEFEFDCGMLSDGTSMLAGTEECDWECPHS